MNSGFSEFETYGTYVEKYYKGLYVYRDTNTIRNGKCLFKGLPYEEVLEWLSKDYYAISFEKCDKEILSGALAENNFIRTLFPPPCIHTKVLASFKSCIVNRKNIE